MSKQLIINKYGKKLPQYRTVFIYPLNNEKEIRDKFNGIKEAPTDKGADENKIPLCLNCVNSYDMDPVIDDYKKLVKIKEQDLNTARLNQNLQNATLEQQIGKVTRKLNKLKSEDLQSKVLKLK